MNMKSILVFLTILSLSSVNAQSWDELKQDICDSGELGLNLSKSITSPSKVTQKNFLISGGISALAMLADNSVRQYALNHQQEVADNIFKIDSYYGNTRYMIGGPMLLYAGGFLSGNKEIKEMGLHTLQAVFYTGLMTMATKVLIGRSRPYREDGPFSFDPFSVNIGNRSFFSGHTSTVFAVSTVMASKIDHLLWKIAWYGAAALVGGARIHHDKHWFSDVVAGALAGYYMGRFVINQNDIVSKESLSVTPSIQNSGIPLLYLSVPF